MAKSAEQLRTSEREAVDVAATSEQPELARDQSFREKLEAFRARHPLPPPTGELADKAFFDELSGEFD